jgi:hypothetical protein
MALMTVCPTAADRAIANFIASRTDPPAEEIAEFLTWGADEHFISAVTAAWWLYTRRKSAPVRCAGDHILLTTLAAALLPHLLKALFDQERPDRLLFAVTCAAYRSPGTPATPFLPDMPYMSARWLRPLRAFQSDREIPLDRGSGAPAFNAERPLCAIRKMQTNKSYTISEIADRATTAIH